MIITLIVLLLLLGSSVLFNVYQALARRTMDLEIARLHDRVALRDGLLIKTTSVCGASVDLIREVRAALLKFGETALNDPAAVLARQPNPADEDDSCSS